MQRLRAMAAEGWKRGGLLKGAGIPSPTGPLEVGCMDWMPRFRTEGNVLLMRLFYPTESGLVGSYEYAKWFSHLKYAKSYAKFMNTKESGELAAILEGKIIPRTPAVESAPLASSVATGGTLPLVIFSHGLSAMRTVYSGICCDLASHGFLVASIEHGDESAGLCLRRVPSLDNDGSEYQDDWILFRELKEGEKEFPLRQRQLKQRSLEMQKALDLLCLLNQGEDVHNMMEKNYDFAQFKGRLKVDVAAVMGHSFGGATAIQVLSEDNRFKCGIAMDCWMYPLHRDFYKRGVSQPLLFVNSHSFQWANNIAKMMSLLKPPNERGISSCQLLTIRGTNHFSQTDVFFIQPRLLSVLSSSLDPTTAHHVNLDLCHAFLKRFLLLDHAHQQRVPSLDGGEGASQHVIFGTNVDWQEENQSPPHMPSMASKL